MSMIRSVVAVGLVLAVAGCAPTVVRGASETVSGPPPPRVPVLKPVDACSLVKPDEAASAGLPAGRPNQLADLRICEFDGTPEERRKLTGSITLDEGPGKGLDDFRPPPGAIESAISKETVAGYGVTVFPQDHEQCMVTIDINTDENVTVQTAFFGQGQHEPVCEVARKMVKFIVPRLPKK
ncbi:DUF3558 domain-containing protein [Allokutzneria sp. A3M-2-11 16]|uniref:DUF3558 family protein n=1 Tax=Allokutzneria sp. A3M-2-11 16 TaxID=2962043 RepID=UPI0020B8DA90|nr:DUF3558 family protein [Allokutzneria sp. A3M-2-11 16]MCP3801769.1 DUF3558 domain-containing protein [Allokutzneria sp. A3M-2-11 16]